MKKPRAGIILEESGERRGKGKHMKLAFCDYREKVLGCMYGKTIGGTLGAPFECYRGVFDVGFYTQSASRPVPNEFTMEIKSEGRMAKYYIPLVFLNGNCTEADE